MTNIIDLEEFRNKAKLIDETPLPEVDFGERLQRIRSSLDKINRLMADLKRMNNGDLDERSEISVSRRSFDI